MNNTADTIMIFLVLTNLTLLGLSRLGTCIRVVAVQGVVLGLLPLLLNEWSLELHLVLFSIAIISLKGIVFPWMLRKTLRDLNTQREIEPFVGYGTSIALGTAILVICMWLSSRLPLPVAAVSKLIVPVAFFTIMSGLFLIISRKKALTQVLGYLVMENGIYTFGVALVEKQPILVELGILLDVFVAVFVMGIAMFHINREFDHIDTDQLSRLKV
ncbi:MAG: NADH-quinone oxidoreductase subunit K [Phycisphaerae bacterium]|jgi:hydrogenase-4 component E